MTQIRKKRLAIIGAGAHARAQHYPVLCHLDEVDLCAACDLAPAKLAEVQKLYNIPAGYADYREMIRKEQPAGVVVVMPPVPMVPIVLDCIEQGAHVMIEKPPGCTSAEAQRILDAAARQGRKVMVSMNRRFMPLVRRLKATANERGLVYCAATYNKDGFFGRSWTWPGSLPVCDAIHLIDLMRFVAGEVAEVWAAAAKRDAEFTNSHSATVVFASGAFGTVNTHHCVGARVHRFEVHARGMSAYLDVGDTAAPAVELLLDGKRAESAEPLVDLPPGIGVDNYYETRHFARYVAGEEEAESALADVIESVRLAEAIASGYRGAMAEFRPA